jgi:Family of unknown function (DUF6812)
MSNENLTYTMRLEVFLQAAVVRGVLATNQDRLSNFLIVRSGDEVFSLREATLETHEGKPLTAETDEYLIYLQEVCLIADLDSKGGARRSAADALYIKKDQSRALLSAGPYLVQGSIHLLPGSALHDLVMEKSQFLPVTDATLVGCADLGPRTYLVNRGKIGFMTARGDGLVEF